MKLQLLLLVCLFAMLSALAVRKPSRLASGSSSSSRINNYGPSARDDDFDFCGYGWCWECDREEKCDTHSDCRIYNDDGDFKHCWEGFCCEFEGGRCVNETDCFDDDDDDD